MKKLLEKIPQFLFFTGKGGVGKTSMSCTIAYALAQKGKKVLLISTDPASNLDEVLDTKLCSSPKAIKDVPHLFAMNINPVVAANEYKEKMTAPYKGILPPEAIAQMEEQLSGACTVEIAGFNEFSKYVGDENISSSYEHIILDTAPTGHTLRLLNLPAAWNDFIADNQTGSSCLGPVSGLSDYKILYEKVVNNLKNIEKTLLILVSRAEKLSLKEASSASVELASQGLQNQHLVINGVFTSNDEDEIAQAFALKSLEAKNTLPKNLEALDKTEIGFYPNGVVGVKSLEAISSGALAKEFENSNNKLQECLPQTLEGTQSWETLLNDLEENGSGLIMTMGKGGVGKTTMASLIANKLASKGHKVVLSTTDPAAHLNYISSQNENLSIERIDPKEQTKLHVNSVIAKNEGKLSPEDMALLKEELSSPCIEEIATFQAFAKTVDRAKDAFVVLDTAPTGHTLLLLDASNAYHKEVLKNTNSEVDEALIQLLPRLKDETFTKILLVSLAEATPTHEAKDLQEDLKRADIKPFAWIVNRSFALTKTSNNLLCQKGLNELNYINEIKNDLAKKLVISPWIADEIDNTKILDKLL